MQPTRRDSTPLSAISAIRSSAGFPRPKGLPESSSGHSATNFKQANSGTVGNFEPQEIAHCPRISLFVPELGGDRDDALREQCFHDPGFRLWETDQRFLQAA